MSENTIDLRDEHGNVYDFAAPLVYVIRTAVNGAGKYVTYVGAMGVTRETVKDHARALAVLAYPNEKPVQAKDGVRTKFGNAVQAAAAGLRAALPKEDAVKPVTLRVSLSGEGGGTTVIPVDHPLYETVRALVGATTED